MSSRSSTTASEPPSKDLTRYSGPSRPAIWAFTSQGPGLFPMRATCCPTLALQLRSTFDVSVLCGGLMGAAPHRPGDHMGWSDPALGQAHRHAPDLLPGPADQRAAWPTLLFVFLGGGSWFA